MVNHKLPSLPVFNSRSMYSVMSPPLFLVPSTFHTIHGFSNGCLLSKSSFAKSRVMKLLVAPVSMSMSTFQCVFPSLKTWRKIVSIHKALWVAKNTLLEKRAQIQVNEFELIENPLPISLILPPVTLVLLCSVSWKILPSFGSSWPLFQEALQ